MAPEASNPKRKRGRPSNASKLEINASQERNDAAEAYETDAPDQMRQKKRGRPRKSTGSPDEEPSPAPESSKPAKKRGRPSMGNKARDLGEDQDELTPTQQKRKRGRPSLKGRGHEEEDILQQSDEETESPPSRQGTRRGRNHADQESEEDQLQNDTPVPAKRKRGRPSLQARRDEEEGTPEQGPTKGKKQGEQRKRGRPSLRDIDAPNAIQRKPSAKGKAAIDSPSNAASGKRRGRPPGSTRASAGAAAEDSPRPTSRRSPEAEAEAARDAPVPKKKKRQSHQDADADDDDDSPPSPSKPYLHVSPHVHRIRHSTIESKWTPLPDSTISAASSMLLVAHRPVLQRLSGSEQRHAHTSAALRLVSHRITRKLAKGIPFPPASMPPARVPRGGRQVGAASAAATVTDGRAIELDFESVLDAKQALERQLDPALHAVELLTREKEKLEKELEQDYEALRNLESSAKAQGREYRGMLKKAHVLAPTPETVHERWKQRAEQDISFNHSNNSVLGGLFSDLEDPELKSLALQLSDHMESIKNNLQQTDGIVPQLARSKAALQDVLFKQLGQDQYERVVLG
ncbi:CENP-Q, a CENPA-CAD centromere complex subunit domain-containing protein [Trichoderma evansii]